ATGLLHPASFSAVKTSQFSTYAGRSRSGATAAATTPTNRCHRATTCCYRQAGAARPSKNPHVASARVLIRHTRDRAKRAHFHVLRPKFFGRTTETAGHDTCE